MNIELAGRKFYLSRTASVVLRRAEAIFGKEMRGFSRIQFEKLYGGDLNSRFFHADRPRNGNRRSEGSAGAVAWLLYSAYLFVAADMYWLRKSLVGSIPLGVLLVLASVARQRMLELPRDRYRRVKR